MDPISDMLIRIKNASRAGLETVSFPHSEIKFQIASILEKRGFLSAINRKTHKVGKRSIKNIEVSLAYTDGKPKIHDVLRVSKLSRRVFKGKKELYPVKSGHGVSIITTSRGVMSDAEARKAGIGGEVLAEVW